MTNETMAAWNRYFITALRDLENPQLKNLQEDIKSNILKKLNKVKLIATKEQLQEIICLFTESNQGKKEIKKTNVENFIFKEIKILKRDYTKFGGSIHYKTSLTCKNTTTEYNWFITTSNVLVRRAR